MDNQTPAYKHCTKCGTTKPTTDFWRHASSKDGLQASCKACKGVSNKQWAEANPGKHAENSRKWRAANPEKQAENSRKWRKANPEKHAEITRVSNAKIRARNVKRAHRYIHAFEYFEGRQGWTDALAATVLRDPRGYAMEWMVPELDDYVAEYV